jgi:hypothetical protein
MVEEKNDNTDIVQNDNSGISGSVGLIDEARNVNTSLEENLNKFKELLDRQETMKIKEQLAGKAEAGEVKIEKEQTALEYSQEVMSGKHNVE